LIRGVPAARVHAVREEDDRLAPADLIEPLVDDEINGVVELRA
jgi:hypothetical protein